jgi:hypothetical protein
MNEHDKSNLEFLLQTDQKSFLKWYQQATADDIEYAMELFAKAKAEMMIMEIELMDDVEDLTQAQQVIHKMMSK